METDAGTGSDGLVDAGAENPGPVADAGSQPQGGGENPAWAPFKEQLGEVPYRLIQPTLAEMDKKANERFEAIHKEYEPLKGFSDLGVTPDQVRQQQQIIDLLNNDPLTFYNMLGQNPQIAAALQQGTEEPVEEQPGDEDPFDLAQHPQFQALQQQNQQMMQMLQERQQQEQAQQMDQQIETEMSDVFGKHPDLNEQDQRQAIIVWSNMVQMDPNATLDQAVEQVAGYKQSILSTPRPGASAPQVMPTNGSSPSPNSNAQMGAMSNKDTRNLVQQMLANQG
jgi:hypothetical protein